MHNPHGSWWSVSPTYISTCFNNNNNYNNNKNNNSYNLVSCSILYLFQSEDNTKSCVENLNQFIKIAIINWLMCSLCGKEVFIFAWLDWCLFLHRWETLLEGPVSCANFALLKYHRQISKIVCIFIMLQCQVPIVCLWRIRFSWKSGLNEMKLKVSL